MAKRNLLNDEPNLMGFIVLNNAKQQMLEFRYNFLGRIMQPKVFCAMEMDTDFRYLALTESSLYGSFTKMAETERKKMTISTTDKAIAVNQKS